MELALKAGHILQEARSLAGLSQRDLARRAGTSQSEISRIEQGRISPTLATLEKLLHAAGYDGHLTLVPLTVRDSHMLEDITRILALTPEDRLREIRNLSRFTAEARRA